MNAYETPAILGSFDAKALLGEAFGLWFLGGSCERN